MKISTSLVQELINEQFPQWSKLPITPVEESGWDNRTFHLGQELSIRMPSDAKYSPQILKEFKWLPIFSKQIECRIATPVALGCPSINYPWHWTINQWIKGKTIKENSITCLNQLASELALFLKQLEAIDTTGGPTAGAHNFHRGGQLSVYDDEMNTRLPQLEDNHLRGLLQQIWQRAISTQWTKSPIWIHGDLARGNILCANGRLQAIIDFGQCAIGDPACDLVFVWDLLDAKSREQFRLQINFDCDTWIRAMAWAVWKTICWPVTGTNTSQIIANITKDYNVNFA